MWCSVLSYKIKTQRPEIHLPVNNFVLAKVPSTLLKRIYTQDYLNMLGRRKISPRKQVAVLPLLQETPHVNLGLGISVSIQVRLTLLELTKKKEKSTGTIMKIPFPVYIESMVIMMFSSLLIL